MRKQVLMSMLVIAVAAALIGGATMAWFTSEGSVEANTFQAGELEVNLDGEIFAVNGNLAPGDIVTADEDGNPGWVTITVGNTGNLDFGYFANFVLGGDTELAEAIFIKNWNTIQNKADGTEAWSDHFIIDGVPQYGYFLETVDTNEDGKISLAEWVAADNVGMGVKEGWDVGALKPGASFVNELELKFDSNANDDYQNLALAVGYKVVSSQVNAEALTELMRQNDLEPSSSAPFIMNETMLNRLNQQ